MKGNSMSAEANVGVVGLAAMGGSLARNLAHHGNKVAVFNRTYARTEKLMNEHGTEGEFFPAKTLEEFVDSLSKPRTAIIMVKAGEPTDAMINALADLMEPAYGFHSLFRFKLKFHPDEAKVYICYPDPAKLPQISLAVAQAYVPSLTPAEAMRFVRTIVPTKMN